MPDDMNRAESSPGAMSGLRKKNGPCRVSASVFPYIFYGCV